MLSTWKQIFPTCVKRHTPKGSDESQPTHCGCSSPSIKYDCVTIV